MAFIEPFGSYHFNPGISSFGLLYRSAVDFDPRFGRSKMRPLAALVPLASLALALVAASTESTASADVCVFTQNCDASVFGPPCHPIAQTFAPTPFSDNSSTASPLQCPLYANSSCCNGHQNNALKFNFELIDGSEWE